MKNLALNSCIKVLAILPTLIPSSIILVVEPLMYLLKLGKIKLRVRLENLYIGGSDFEWADLVVFCRNTEPTYDNILESVLAHKKPYIYELDDNFFELPLDVPGAEYHRAPSQIAQLEKYIKNANLVRVYSLSLETSVKQYTTKVKVAKAPFNLFSIPATPPQHTSQKLKLIYATSRTTGDNLSQIFIKDLTRILNEYGNDIEFHFWGFMPEELKVFPSVKFHRFISDYKKYIQTIYKQGYDIGLAPMKNDLFHNSKTNNKFREYGACWIAGIYSDSEIYSGCVEDNITGLLVSNEKGEWYKAIAELIQDPNMRQTIQNRTRTVIEQEYSLDVFSSLLMKDINQVLLEPPQSIGPINYRAIKSTNGNQRKKNYLQIVAKLVSIIRRTYGSIQKNGYVPTLRLILQNIERYIEYFALSWRIALGKL